MPLHAYTTPNRPPTNLDHLLAHPFEVFLALFGIGAGGVTLWAAYAHHGVSTVVDQLQEPAVVGVALSVLIGGILVLRGLFDDSDDLLVGWRIERAGAVLSGFGWGVYAYISSALVSPVSLGMFASFSAAYLTRVAATYWLEREVKAAIDKRQGGGR